ncbi:SgcJ/EcaC family oxidoreductase [Phenylobacterium sp.]|uniref:YybH family protein n=1 Tax=Phenylobacterium sp. TaxID=1871053 RepID=UPI0025D71AB6|nr:SgcJ/EcaC family oxidoreductase [Phenylobacterium sp.]
MMSTAGSAAAVDDLRAAKAAIERANLDWLVAMQTKDAERLAAPYSERGVFVLGNGQEIIGRPAIVAFYRDRLSGPGQVVSGGIHHQGMTVAQDGLIYEWGHGGATTLDPSGRKITSDGPYLTVWKRGADGSWKIVRNLVF